MRNILSFLGALLVGLGSVSDARACTTIANDVLYYNFRGELRVMHPGVQTPGTCQTVFTNVAGGVRGTADLPARLPPQGTAVPMTVSRTMSLPSARVAVSRALGTAALVDLLAGVANDVRCRRSPSLSSSVVFGGLECDQGLASDPNGTLTSWRIEGSSYGPIQSDAVGSQPTPLAVAQRFVTLANAGESYTRWRVVSCGAQFAQNGSVKSDCTIQINTGNDASPQWVGTNPMRTEQQSSTGNACPDGLAASTLGGVPFCPGGVYAPATLGQVADRIADSPTFNNDPAGAVGAANNIPGSDVFAGAGPSVIAGPNSATGQSTSRSGTGTGGGQWTETSTPAHTITYNNNNTFTWNTTTTTVRNENGTTTTTTTTDGPSSNPQGDVITCGLPDTPPCKIDENGTPTQEQAEAEMNPQRDAEDAYAPVRDFIQNRTGMPAFPTIPWNFQLPTSCGPISAPAFAPFLTSIDICVFQPTFHDLMSVVWQLGALFGAIGLMWREQLSN